MTVDFTLNGYSAYRKPATNIVLAIGGLNGFVSTEVQNSTFVLRIKLSAKNPAHRQYADRYASP
jgi:hypothetical protein